MEHEVGAEEEAVRAKVRCVRPKFRQLAPVLTFRGALLKVECKEYRVCVVYGSETWLMKAKNLQ